MFFFTMKHLKYKYGCGPLSFLCKVINTKEKKNDLHCALLRENLALEAISQHGSDLVASQLLASAGYMFLFSTFYKLSSLLITHTCFC